MTVRPTRDHVRVAAILALAPVLTVLVLRLPLINQLEYADAWFYSGYAWAPKYHFELFGFNYFAVRFPAILPIAVFDRVLGVHAGYVVLRYLLAVTAGAAVYLGVWRFAGGAVALATAVLLYLNPFFTRMLLWDYAGYLAVTFGVAGFALWWWSDGRRAAWTLIPGVLLAAAGFANPFIGTTILVLMLVEGVAAARSGPEAVRALGRRILVCLLGGVAVFLAGWLSYLAVLGSLSPYDLVRPVIEFAGENDAQSGLYQRPVSSWLFHEARIWAPVLLSLALLVVMRRRVLGHDLPARVAQTCIAYTAFLWVARFTVTSSAVETWWAYNVTVVASAPALGLLLHELGTTMTAARRWPLVVLVVAALTAVAVRDVPAASAPMYDAVQDHEALLIAVLAAALVMLVALISRARNVRLAALVGVVTLLVLMSYSPSRLDGRGGTGIFSADGDQEWDGYAAGRDLAEIIRRHTNRGRRVYLWFTNGQALANMTWVDLPQNGQTIQELGLDQPFSRILPLGFNRLMLPNTDSVLVTSVRARDLADARTALRGRGFAYEVLERGRLADGRLPFELLHLTGKPA